MVLQAYTKLHMPPWVTIDKPLVGTIRMQSR